MLLRTVARLRVGIGLNKCENEGSSVHDPSDAFDLSVNEATEAMFAKIL